jgi:hypothetical protein
LAIHFTFWLLDEATNIAPTNNWIFIHASGTTARKKSSVTSYSYEMRHATVDLQRDQIIEDNTLLMLGSDGPAVNVKLIKDN